jgi:hypothetical protein
MEYLELDRTSTLYLDSKNRLVLTIQRLVNRD